MKTGLLDYTPASTDIQLADVWDAEVGYPETFGPNGILNFAMLGNDKWGDCFWASAAHETQVLAGIAGRAPVFSDQSVLDTYGTYLNLYGRAGLEANPAADRGTDPTSGASWRRKHGIQDDHGINHHIGAFVFDDDPQPDRLANAIHTFGAVEFCVELPRSAEETFDSGVWDYDPSSPIVGGHAISGVGRRNGRLVIVSWGKEVEVTDAFLEKYLQTTIVYFSSSILNAEHESPAGLNKAALLEALAEVTAR